MSLDNVPSNTQSHSKPRPIGSKIAPETHSDIETVMSSAVNTCDSRPRDASQRAQNRVLSLQKCSICGKPSRLLNPDHCGYQKPERYAIYECAYCDLQFADPLHSLGGIYEHIYRNSAVLPGYARYHRYANSIARQSDPLVWLAQQESVYWFVREVILQHGISSDDLVYEIGSGLGYLTYALQRAGINATGLDISETAVLAATEQFGPYYHVASASAVSNIEPGTSDVVIMNELIEHVEEPEGLLADIHRLLRPGGIALITTPNKSIFPIDAYWRTDNPPVHYWWFSETSMRNLAARQDFEVSFFDFTKFNSFRVGRIQPSDTGLIDQSQPTLDERGVPLRRDGTPRLTLRQRLRAMRRRVLCDIYGDARLAISRSAAAIVTQRSDSMGVILTRPAD
jgi:SAM-dependent methyltransferase